MQNSIYPYSSNTNNATNPDTLSIYYRNSVVRFSIDFFIYFHSTSFQKKTECKNEFNAWKPHGQQLVCIYQREILNTNRNDFCCVFSWIFSERVFIFSVTAFWLKMTWKKSHKFFEVFSSSFNIRSSYQHMFHFPFLSECNGKVHYIISI